MQHNPVAHHDRVHIGAIKQVQQHSLRHLDRQAPIHDRLALGTGNLSRVVGTVGSLTIAGIDHDDDLRSPHSGSAPLEQ